MAKRKRNIQILFCVSPEEKKLIRRKMIESKTKNMGAYLRKMAIDGYIVNTDTTPLKKQYEEMHKEQPREDVPLLTSRWQCIFLFTSQKKYFLSCFPGSVFLFPF